MQPDRRVEGVPAAKSTDAEWEKWGQRDPYFGVLTDERFRSERLTPETKRQFFDSGFAHVDWVLTLCRGSSDPHFRPRRVLDFGCGVGRLVVPFSRIADQVVGMDISPSMLAEAGDNCAAHEVANAVLVMSDDALTQAEGEFDLVHSCIVLQHIEVPRGRQIFSRLVDKIAPGGCGAIQVTFAWDVHAASYGQPQPPPPPPPPTASMRARACIRRVLESVGLRSRPVVPEPAQEPRDPEMQMNYYNISELMFVLQRAGVERCHAEISDHGGALGVFLFFHKPKRD